MKSRQQQMIAANLKEARLAKGYTQKELSELSNVSVRSIQRIENGDIIPRSYTIKTHFEVLGISFQNMQEEKAIDKLGFIINKQQKIILTVAVPTVILLGLWAFVAQSATTPETTFETLIMVLVALFVLTAFLFILWRS